MPASSPPTMTVLVCTRDRPDLLDRCLRSLLACSPQPEEILVVDQSRDDRSHDAVQALRAPALRYVRDPGTGLSVAQNLGFGRATGEVVLVTDDDCVLAPDWVGAALGAFAADDRLALLGGRVLPLGDDAPDRYPVSTRTSTVSLSLNGDTVPWDVGSGNNFALRRSTALAVGGNDERLGPGAQLRGGADMDLFRRVLRSGVAGRYEPAMVVLHERATAAQRLGRRVPYGYGTGACLVLWARQGDRRVLRLLFAWLRLRTRRLASGLRHRDSLRIREELLVLIGTVGGLAAGLRGPAGPVSSIDCSQS